MSMFKQIFDKIFGEKGEKARAIPGAMGDLLAKIGIYELGPHLRSGTPMNVLAGCPPTVIMIPQAATPAKLKNGKPMMSKTKRGRFYRVMDQYGVETKHWRAMMHDQKRKAEGRWYSGEPQSSIDERKAAA